MSSDGKWRSTYEQRKQDAMDTLTFALNPMAPDEDRLLKWAYADWDLDTLLSFNNMIYRAIEQGTSGLDDRAARGR